MSKYKTKPYEDDEDAAVERLIERRRREFFDEWFAYISEYDADDCFFYEQSIELFEEN